MMRSKPLSRSSESRLKQGAPLKRKPFKAKLVVIAKPERPPVPLYRLTRQCAPTVIAEHVRPVEKHVYIRSPKLMRAYGALPCQHCGRDDKTICGAHSNWGMGKGERIKADDNRCASLCSVCHSMIDQGSRLTERERKAIWWPAHVKTVALLISMGLWVKRVPFPDTSEPPWLQE